MSLLSVDILHQVFKFFVSNNQTVDGESLRVAILVCKQWKGVVDSRSLWATPARIKERDVNAGDNDNDNDDCQFYTVHQSLRIKEQTDFSLSNEKLLQASLMGFVKLKRYRSMSNHPEFHFFVRERATGFHWLLTISGDGQKHPSLIRDLYVNHFELKEKLFLQDRNNSSETFFPPQRFPLGISIWKGRVVRWYRSGTEMEARSTKDQVSPNREILLHRNDAFIELSKRFALVSHLIDLENDALWDKDDERFHTEGRQHIVDWMVEIVECFALEDRTIFQAILLFDRFIASNDRIVSTSRFQLVAGACLLIASKCNKVFVTEKDISFCCDNLFSVAHVMATEELILKQLEWKLACPSSIEFVIAFSTILGVEENSKIFCLYCYILELSLALDTSLRHPPSIIAASSMVLAHYCLRKNDMPTLWPDELAHVTGFDLKDLVACSVQLSKDIDDNIRFVMIYRRYSKPCRHNAAEIPIPVLASTTILTAYEERLRHKTR